MKIADEMKLEERHAVLQGKLFVRISVGQSAALAWQNLAWGIRRRDNLQIDYGLAEVIQAYSIRHNLTMTSLGGGECLNFRIGS